MCTGMFLVDIKRMRMRAIRMVSANLGSVQLLGYRSFCSAALPRSCALMAQQKIQRGRLEVEDLCKCVIPSFGRKECQSVDSWMCKLHQRR